MNSFFMYGETLIKRRERLEATRLMLPLLVSLSLLSGCGEKEKFVIYGSSEKDKEVESILKEDYVDKTTVIQYDDSMLVAVQIKPWDKWRKTKLEKNYKRNLMKNSQIKKFSFQLIIKFIMKPIK